MRKIILDFNENSLLTALSSKGFQGLGTKENPFICNDASFLGERFRIKKSNLYVIFEKCNFGIVGLIKCKNLTFENCTFENLSLVDSSDLHFKSCEFSVINFMGAHKNLFTDSILKEVNNYSNDGNTFSDCCLHEKTREILGKKVSDFSRILQLIKVVSILIAISLVLILTTGFVMGFNWALIIGHLVSLTFLLVLYYLFRDRTSPKAEPNKFLNVKKLEQR